MSGSDPQRISVPSSAVQVVQQFFDAGNAYTNNAPPPPIDIMAAAGGGGGDGAGLSRFLTTPYGSPLYADLRVFIDQELSPHALGKQLQAAAEQGLVDIDAPPSYVTYVDGQVGAPLEDAQQTVVYRFGYAKEAAKFALDYLRSRAPVKDGHFVKSFYLSIDGHFVSAEEVDFSTISPFSQIIIGNTQPYDRKIDVQFSDTVAYHFSRPAGLYDDCVRALTTEFGPVIKTMRLADFQFPKFETYADTAQWAKFPKYAKASTYKLTEDRHLNFGSPAVIILPETYGAAAPPAPPPSHVTQESPDTYSRRAAYAAELYRQNKSGLTQSTAGAALRRQLAKIKAHPTYEMPPADINPPHYVHPNDAPNSLPVIPR